MITLDQIRAMSIGSVNESNARSVMVALEQSGAKLGVDRPHRLAQYLPQIMHESADFKYDREIWGPTAAQKRYDTRTDLGNTAAADGDGRFYAGRTAMQITGKSNYRQFRDWCQEQGLNPPDFVEFPELVNIDPWEGLGPLWYWSTRDLNAYADKGDVEMITRRINGGLNGYSDRLARLVRCSLVLIGYRATDIREFQEAAGLKVDGIAGPATRAALHAALRKLPAESVSASPPPPTVATSRPILKIGAKGDVVVEMQQALRSAGITVTVDGDFGDKTRLAVLNFQRQVGLIADGKVGPATWHALLSPAPTTTPETPVDSRLDNPVSSKEPGLLEALLGLIFRSRT